MPIRPPPLRAGDTVRFVSPASMPDREGVEQRARIFESWGLKVDYGNHVFDKHGYFAGPDADRLADLNDAIRDPSVRAIIASRGGKGSYRLVDQLDFDALKNDPKLLVGFSDITALHFAIWNQCEMVAIHGALTDDGAGNIPESAIDALHTVLMDARPVTISRRDSEPTSALTTTGTATGRLLGGSLNIISTAAGWLLPDLRGAIFVVEVVNMGPGQVDRVFQMLRKAGHLDGVAGIAVGQFSDFNMAAPITVVDLLREHLSHLDVPILGGLPIGHGPAPLPFPHGCMATLDADNRRLDIEPC